jgi:hypothetical protein
MIKIKKQSTAISIKGRRCLQGCEMLRIPQCLDNRITDGSEVVSLVHQPCSTPPIYFLVLISVRGWSRPQGIVQLEESGKLKKFNELCGTRNINLPACSIMPQPTTLLCIPWQTKINVVIIIIIIIIIINEILREIQVPVYLVYYINLPLQCALH